MARYVYASTPVPRVVGRAVPVTVSYLALTALMAVPPGE
jgi:hypothetical protein